TPEVAHISWRDSDRCPITLALEEDWEAQEGQSINASPINAEVSGPSGYRHAKEASLSQQPLSKPFEPVRRESSQDLEQPLLPFGKVCFGPRWYLHTARTVIVG